MRLVTTALFIASLAAVSAPASAGDRLSDADYLRAARCQGIAAKLGGPDTGGIDALVRTQGERRDARLRNQARAARADAEREAAADARRARLTAELNGRCATFMSTTQVAANAN